MYFTLTATNEDELKAKIFEVIESVKNSNNQLADVFYELKNSVAKSIIKDSDGYKATLIYVAQPKYNNYQGIEQSRAV